VLFIHSAITMHCDIGMAIAEILTNTRGCVLTSDLAGVDRRLGWRSLPD